MRERYEIEEWLRGRLVAATKRTPGDIDLDTPFTSLGLDSILIVTLAGDLEDWLGISLDPTVFWEYPSIRLLGDWLTNVQRSALS